MRDYVLVNFIKEARTEMGLSQKELARRVGISKNSLSCFERGIFYPSAYTASKLCFVLDTPFEKLFYLVPSGIPFVKAGIPFVKGGKV